MCNLRAKFYVTNYFNGNDNQKANKNTARSLALQG